MSFWGAYRTGSNPEDSINLLFNFDQEQTVNMEKDRWLKSRHQGNTHSDADYVCIICNFLGIISNEGRILALHIFHQSQAHCHCLHQGAESHDKALTRNGEKDAVVFQIGPHIMSCSQRNYDMAWFESSGILSGQEGEQSIAHNIKGSLNVITVSVTTNMERKPPSFDALSKPSSMINEIILNNCFFFWFSMLNMCNTVKNISIFVMEYVYFSLCYLFSVT